MSTSADESVTDISDLFKQTRLSLRVVGILAGLVALASYFGDAFGIVVNVIAALISIVALSESAVVRGEIVQDGTLIKVHSLLKPLRVPVAESSVFDTEEFSDWWTNGITLRAVGITNTHVDVAKPDYRPRLELILIQPTAGTKKHLEMVTEVLYEFTVAQKPTEPKKPQGRYRRPRD